MSRDEIKKSLEEIVLSPNGWVEQEEAPEIESYYLGSAFYLNTVTLVEGDIVTNGMLYECIEYWENLYDCAEELGCWIKSVEGNSTDIFLMREKKGVYYDNKG